MQNNNYRVGVRALQGAFLGIGAPTGWLFIRWFQGAELASEIYLQAGLYTYMLAGTVITFAIFGWYVGNKESMAMTQALRDGLTGLYNVRFFNERINEEIKRAHREHTPLTVISFDIDHFKNVNDTYGHPFGDNVLKAVCQSANNVLREHDVLARVGGEEFAALLPRCKIETGVETAERIRNKIAAAFVISKKGKKVMVTVSLGLTSLTITDDNNSLLERADTALYQAKETGRNRVVTA